MENCRGESQEPEISVLMSVYNPESEAQLRRAVASIIGQTFTNWEMILYDDGSDPEKREIIRRTAQMDPRIHYVRGKKNRGLGYGLNASLKLARGRYIARMDDDDLSHPNRFARQYVYLETHPEYQWVGTNTGLMDQRGIWGSRTMPRIPKKEDFLKFSPYIHPSVIFRKEVLADHNGYRPSHKAEDYELFMRLHAAGCQGYNLQEELYYYREDRDACRHLSCADQIEEIKIRLQGFLRLGILNIRTARYVIKPAVVGLLPGSLSAGIKRHLRSEMHVEGYKRRQAEKI